jgi:YDG domain/MBG domain (YGX type)
MKKLIYPKQRMSELILRLVLIVALAGMAMMAQAQATVRTDLDDYPPGATAIITGAGFLAGEEVELHVHHADSLPLGTDPQYHQPWTVIADVDGNFTTSWYVPEDGDALGATFLLTAHGSMGSEAEWTFTDSAPWTMVVSPSPVCVGSASTFTFTVTSSGNGNGSVGCVKVTVPTAFSSLGTPVITAAPDGTTTWTIAIAGGVITANANANANRLMSTEVLRFTISATATTATGSPFVWTTSGTENANCSAGSGSTAPTTQPSVTVNDLPNNTSTGFTGNTICSGGTGTLTFDAIDATFTSPYSIQYTNGTTTWSQSISSASATTFNVVVNPTITTTYTLVSITNGIGCVRTTGFGDATAQITVNQLPSITASPANHALTYGSAANFTATATGTGITYQWQEFISAWNNISNGGIYSGATSNSLSLSLPTVAMSGRQYRVVVSGTCAPPATSAAATLTVTAKGTIGSFTADNKVYDATTSATVLTRTLSGVLAGDVANVSLSGGTAAFADANAANAKVVTLTGSVLAGTAAGNYSLTSVNTTTANIAQADAVVNVTGSTTTYDALAYGASGTATGVGGINLLTDLDLTNSLSLGLSFTNVPGGTANWTFEGGTNYIDESGSVAIVINKRPITITADAKTKIYGNADPALTAQATNVAGTDAPTGSLVRNAGENVGSYQNQSGHLHIRRQLFGNLRGSELEHHAIGRNGNSRCEEQDLRRC